MTPNYSTPFSQKTGLESEKEQKSKSSLSKKTHDKTNLSELSVIQKQPSNENETSAIKPDEAPAINNFESPLLTKDQKAEAVGLGHSYGSKKVAMGPTFFNLRIVCECLGRALRRHLEFSFGVFWFLDDRARARALSKGEGEAHGSAKTQFSYKFDEALKLDQECHDYEDSFDRDIDDLDLQVAVTEDIREEAQVEVLRRQQILAISSEAPALDFRSLLVRQQLDEKDKKIQELTQLVEKMASKEAKDIAASPVKDIMAMSEAYKMTKAQFLMSQIDLDPIES